MISKITEPLQNGWVFDEFTALVDLVIGPWSQTPNYQLITHQFIWIRTEKWPPKPAGFDSVTSDVLQILLPNTSTVSVVSLCFRVFPSFPPPDRESQWNVLFLGWFICSVWFGFFDFFSSFFSLSFLFLVLTVKWFLEKMFVWIKLEFVLVQFFSICESLFLRVKLVAVNQLTVWELVLIKKIIELNSFLCRSVH